MLTEEKALEEANLLIQKGQLWVYEVRTELKPPAIACIVAVTRISENVACITKVYTDEEWRKKGCAEKLVSYVTSQYGHFLFSRVI